MSAGVKRALLIAWAVTLVGSLTWPFWLVFARPGDSLALRDMMVLPHPYLTHSSLGFGDTAARSVPQDAVLAVIGMTMPATFFVAIAVTAAAGVAAGTAAWVAARFQAPAWAQAATMTVAVWNPFVVERLLQGQWSLAMAAWLLPAVALCRGPWQILAIWACSLTPTGGLFALVTAFVTGVAGKQERRFLPALCAAAACLPWVVPTLVQQVSGSASAASAAAFAPRAETYAGTLGSLLGLGGIWNAGAVPPSRSAGFAVAGIALFLLLATALRRIPRPVLVLAGLGFAVPLVSWLLPGVQGWIVSTLPGGGLVRDASKFLALALPAYVGAAAQLKRKDLAAATLGLALLQVPDAPRALAVLAPVEVTVPDIDHHGRDVFFPERPTLITRSDGIPVVDPATKAMNVVESGALSVDGVLVDAPSPRWQAGESDPTVGLIVRPDGIEDTGAAARPRQLSGLIALGIWFALPLLALTGPRISGRSRSKKNAGTTSERRLKGGVGDRR